MMLCDYREINFLTLLWPEWVMKGMSLDLYSVQVSQGLMQDLRRLSRHSQATAFDIYEIKWKLENNILACFTRAHVEYLVQML